ncbi:MAG: mechanosensitive ion channel family protein [Niabella sp.]
MTDKFNLKDFWAEKLLPWAFTSGVRIIAIVIITIILYFVLRGVIKRIVKVSVVQKDGEDQFGEEQRENTLIHIFTVTLKIVLAIITGLMIAAEFGLQIGPLIASAGVIGLALGFGGQYLIKDIISGLFIIMENQYRIDDVIEAAGLSGKVERITLRVTTLRDIDGITHHIPHGEITTVSNKSKVFARINLDVGVGYGSDIEKVKNVVNRVGEELAKDPDWKDSILTPPQFLRINDLGDSAVVIKILGDTKPAQQWAVTGEMRRRVYDAFLKSDIEIPFPQRVVHVVHSENITKELGGV